MMLKLWKGLIARDRESIARVWVLSGFSPAGPVEVWEALLDLL